MANLNNYTMPNGGCLHSKSGADFCGTGAGNETFFRDSKGFKTKGAIKSAAKKLRQTRVKREQKGFG
tara:strand:+ start:2693 stop:2893 length:201 start_codon:yes stop_codon:yes gene_type:complete